MEGVIVAVAEEETVIVAVRVRPQVIDERGRRRAFGVEPGQLVAERVRPFEDTIGAAGEEPRIALVPDAKPAHRHTLDPLDAGPQRVAPGPVISRAPPPGL